MSRYEKKEERQELKLGDSRGTPSKYSRRLKHLSLGMPRKASHLSSTSIGMFSDSFRSCDMCNLGASFAFSFHFSFMHHASMRQSLVDLQNALCTSLISFEYGFIECFMCFTYIIRSLDCLFLFTQTTAICRMLFCFTYICQSVGISFLEKIKLSCFTYIYLER